MSKCLILLFFCYSLIGAELISVRKDLQNANLIILGDVVGKDNDTYLIKLDKWASTKLNKTNFIKIKTEKKLTKFNKYFFSLGDIKESEQFVITDPLRQIYKIESMGEYDFLIRDYNSDKPLIGQVGLKSTLEYIRKDLGLPITTRSINQFERSQARNNKFNDRKIASLGVASQDLKSKLSEEWILSFLALLTLIPYILRKVQF